MRRRRRRGVGCSHRQAHSSCSACWDALGSVPHNTITACSGVLCSASLCSDCVLLSFVRFPLFRCARLPPFACFRFSALFCPILFSGRFRIFFFCYIFLNLLLKLSPQQFFELNISISYTFVVFCFIEP